ncbi:hypothetical protein OUZ56_011957 [Daphnia magna]|uniref:Uncharacterized protein n=1 Tax=Daphnia magna TaxID=35525 RepID=A0ABQ9Z1L5_9CRUS|nr:hypothetical protein OUZ56_011957 [Daphnia magna]
MQNKPSEETNQDISIKIYVKELSCLMESGMDYEDASKAADCIVQHVLTNTKRCINSSKKTKHNGQPVFTTSSQPSYFTSTPLHTQPLALSGQSVKIPSMYNKQSNNGTTPKYSVTSSIPKMNPLLQQSQAMTFFSNVGIYVDRDHSGRFDDWLAHRESGMVLGDFEESRNHSTETRSKQSVEFHNMQREPEENMRR